MVHDGPRLRLRCVSGPAISGTPKLRRTSRRVLRRLAMNLKDTDFPLRRISGCSGASPYQRRAYALSLLTPKITHRPGNLLPPVPDGGDLLGVGYIIQGIRGEYDEVCQFSWFQFASIR